MATMSPLVVCNNILLEAKHEGYRITLMKLQRLLYFLNCEYIRITGNPLFRERFQVWQYGPVLLSVQEHFSCYKAKAIKQYAKDAMGGSYVINEWTAPNLSCCLRRVWTAFKDCTAIELSEIARAEGSGWDYAFQRGLPEIPIEAMAKDRSYLFFM